MAARQAQRALAPRIRKTRRTASALLLALCCGASLAAGTPDEVFDRYVAAVHAGDMAAVRSLIAPDVERSDFVGCRPEMDNPSCLANYIQATVVGPKGRLKVTRRELAGDTVTAWLEVRSAATEKAGVQRIVGRDIVRVRNGQIAFFRFVPDFGDEATAVFFGTLGIGPRATQATTRP